LNLPRGFITVRGEGNRIHARTLDSESTGITIPSVTTIVNIPLVLKKAGAMNFAQFCATETDHAAAAFSSPRCLLKMFNPILAAICAGKQEFRAAGDVQNSGKMLLIFPALTISGCRGRIHKKKPNPARI